LDRLALGVGFVVLMWSLTVGASVRLPLASLQYRVNQSGNQRLATVRTGYFSWLLIW
jgi:hypothetical protein